MLAVPSQTAHAALVDVQVNWTSMEATYNPSLVAHGGRFFAALKRTTFRKTKGKVFWVNHLYMCLGGEGDLQVS